MQAARGPPTLKLLVNIALPQADGLRDAAVLQAQQGGNSPWHFSASADAAGRCDGPPRCSLPTNANMFAVLAPGQAHVLIKTCMSASRTHAPIAQAGGQHAAACGQARGSCPLPHLHAQERADGQQPLAQAALGDTDLRVEGHMKACGSLDAWWMVVGGWEVGKNGARMGV